MPRLADPNEPPKDTIGWRIWSRMKELGFAENQDLARLAGVSPSTIGRYIANERRPTGDALTKLAIALETSSNWVVYGKEAPTREDLAVSAPAPTPTRHVVPDPARDEEVVAHFEVPMPGSWKGLAAQRPEFMAFGAGRIAAAKTPDEQQKVGIALDYTASLLPRQYGGVEQYELGQMRKLFREGWALVNDENPYDEAAKLPDLPRVEAPSRPPTDTTTETTFQRKLREAGAPVERASTTKPPPGRKSPKLVVGADETVQAKSQVRPKAADGDATIAPHDGLKLVPRKERK